MTPDLATAIERVKAKVAEGLPPLESLTVFEIELLDSFVQAAMREAFLYCADWHKEQWADSTRVNEGSIHLEAKHHFLSLIQSLDSQ